MPPELSPPWSDLEREREVKACCHFLFHPVVHNSEGEKREERLLLGNGVLARMENVLTDEIIACSASSSLSVHEIWGHGGTHATPGTKMPPIANSFTNIGFNNLSSVSTSFPLFWPPPPMVFAATVFAPDLGLKPARFCICKHLSIFFL